MCEYCYKPFSEIEIYETGNIYTCCPSYLPKNYYIGNIFEQSFDEIWNSKKVLKLRENILSNNFSLCNLEICNKEYKENVSYTLHPPYPQYVRLSYDNTCNICCSYCRDCIKTFSNYEKWDKILETSLLPILKNAKIITLSTVGEITVSKHSQELIKKIIEINDKVKFDILSNGILFNETFFEELNLKHRIHRIQITLSASKEETYKKLLRNSNFKKVQENISFLGSLKEKNIIDSLYLGFVTSKINYKEIPEFINFAKMNNAIALIWELRNTCASEFLSDYKNLAVWNKTNNEYNNFVNVIKYVKDNFDKDSYIMPPLFTNLEKFSLLEKFKMNFLNFNK